MVERTGVRHRRRAVLVAMVCLAFLLVGGVRFLQDHNALPSAASGAEQVTKNSQLPAPDRGSKTVQVVPNEQVSVISERVVGSATAPNSGKPVAPVGLTWDIAISPVSPFIFSGTISVTNRGNLGELAVMLAGRGGTVLQSESTWRRPNMANGDFLRISVQGTSQEPGQRGKLLVEAEHTVMGSKRVWLVSIPLDAMVSNPAETTAPIITDDQGQRLILTPAGKN